MKLVFLVTLFFAVCFSQKGGKGGPINPNAGGNPPANNNNASTVVPDTSAPPSSTPAESDAILLSNVSIPSALSSSKANSGPPQFQGSWNLGCTQYANLTFESTFHFGDVTHQTYDFYLDSNCSTLGWSFTASTAYSFEGPVAGNPGVFNVDFFWNFEGAYYNLTVFDQTTLDDVNALGCFSTLVLGESVNVNNFSCAAIGLVSAQACPVEYEVAKVVRGQLFIGDQFSVAVSCSPATRPAFPPFSYSEDIDSSLSGKSGKSGKAGPLMREGKPSNTSSIIGISAGIFSVVSLAGVAYLVTRRRSGYVQLA